MAFEPNRGQFGRGTVYAARGAGYGLFLTRRSAVLTLSVRGAPRNRAGALSLGFVGASATSHLQSASPLPGRISYMIGRDRARWRTGIPTYGRVRYHGVWPGIDALFYGRPGRLEYELVLTRGANPGRIELSLSGAQSIRRLTDGSLAFDLASGVVRQLAPHAYEFQGHRRLPVPSAYVLEGRRLRLRLGAYDRHRTLVIDPTLSYSTYIGGSGADYGHGVAVDSSGAAYVVGHTSSTDFPTTIGAFQTANASPGNDDVFVTKLAPDGKSMAYSTYIGGSGPDGSNQDPGMGIAVDAAGSAYVTGITASSDFPTTAGAFQTALAGSADAFVTKLAPSGTSLAYSTYLGGSIYQTGYAIAVDTAGAAYVTGETNSSNFPTSAGAYQTAYGGNYDAFVTKLAPDGKSLAYSTYLGGRTGADVGYGIAVDASGRAFVTGQSEGFAGQDDFPVTTGAYQTTYIGSPDAFITTIAADGKSLGYSTYLGGAGGRNAARAIALDSSGAAYVTGTTGSSSFPTTAGAFQTTTNGCCYRAFVTKLSADGSSLAYSTYLEGTGFSGAEYGFAIAVDSAGSAFVAGESDSHDFPTTPDAYQKTSGPGGQNAFATQLAADGKSLVYSTYLHGSNAERATGIGLDSTGAFYVEGWTSSTDFPTTAGAAQPASGGNVDAFVSKFSPGSTKRPTSTAVSCSPALVVVGQTATCTATVSDTGAGTKSTPLGTVSFTSDSSGSFANPGTACTLNEVSVGTASCSVDYTPMAVNSGTHMITGAYGGSDIHQKSSGNFGLTVTKRATSTSVSCSPSSVAVGKTTTCTATVSDSDAGTPSTPSGTVTFSSDSSGGFSNPGAACTLTEVSTGTGSCSVDYTPTAVNSGTHAITGAYSGDGLHQASSGSFNLAVTAVPKRPTGTSVSCSPSAVVVGQPTTCTTLVYDGGSGGTTPTGTVSFSSDSSGDFGSGASCGLSPTAHAGVAECSVSYTPRSVGSGKHTITAMYGGDASHQASNASTALSVTSPGGGGGGGTGGGGLSVNFALIGTARTMHHALLFDALGSVANGGRIVNFTWRVDAGEGTAAQAAPCGTTPLAALSFRKSGMHAVTLSATSSSGQSASVTKNLNVPAVDVNALLQPAYDCENPGAGNQVNTADCVKSFGWGVVQVNSRGGENDCFQIQERDLGFVHPARDARFRFTRMFDVHATINGPIAIDGLYLPLPSTVQSSFDDYHRTIEIGKPISIAVGSFRLASVVLNTTVDDPDPRTGLVPLVPSVGLSPSSGKSIGALPLTGLLDVNLSSFKTTDGYNISKIKIHAKLPAPFPDNLPADGYLESDNENGAHITGFQIGPFDTDIVPGFSLRKVQFRYVGGTDEIWQGGADVYLPGQVPPVDGGPRLPVSPSPVPGINFAPPPPDLGIGFKHGGLDHFGIGVNFVAPYRPVLFPGIDLSNIHFALGLNPLRFTGGIGVTIGELIGADGDVFVAFASPDNQYQFPNDVATGDLSPLAGRWLDSFTLAIGADAHLDIPAVGSIPLLNSWILYEAPDYFQLGGHFDFSAGFLELKGDAGGWIWPSQGKFSFGGSINMCVKVTVLGFDLNPCLGNGIVVSSRGAGGCTTIPVPSPFPLAPAIPVTISAGYVWGSGLSVHPFTCDLSDYTEANPRAGDRPAREAPAAAGAWPFRLPGGLPSAEVRITGQGGAPGVTLSGPGGRSYSTASPPKDPRQVLMLQYGDTTIIALNHPPAGAWTITPNSGSAPVTSVAHAQGLPAPKIKARVTGRGNSRTLAYQVNRASGRVITFIEQGARTYRILGVARSGRGHIHFTPADGRGGRRQIVAQVEQNGLHTHTYVVAQYSAPGPQRPARPARLRVSHRGYTVTASWSGVRDATEYEVLVKASDGGREMQIVRGHNATIIGIEPGLHGSVVVDAVSPTGLRGLAARTSFPRVPAARAKPRRHR